MTNWLTKASRYMGKKKVNSPFLQIYNGVETPVNLRDQWLGAGCFLVAGGPSLDKVDVSLLGKPGVITYGLNNSAKTFRPNLWSSVDSPSRFLTSVWLDPTIMKFCGTGKWKQPIWDHDRWAADGFPMNNDYYSETVVQDCPNVIYVQRNNNFQPEHFLSEETANWGNHKDQGGGRSVMIFAIKIIYVLGFRRLYLVGSDFRMSGDKPYSFNEQRTQGAVNNNNNSYRKMTSYFTQLGPYFKTAGFEVYNCSPGSDLTVFPYMDLEKAIERETSHIPNPETENSFGMYIPDR